MKKILLSLLAAASCMMALTGCSEAAKKGEQAAQQLAQAWGDEDAIRKVASDYVAMRDSAGGGSAMDEAFVDACSKGDSIRIMAQAIALSPAAVGEEWGKTIADGLESGDMKINQAAALPGIIAGAYAVLQRDQDVQQCFAAIDVAVEKLSEEKQLAVYAHSCAPKKLAEAMRQDRASGNAADVDRRAKIVETILTGEELNEFKAKYYGK